MSILHPHELATAGGSTVAVVGGTIGQQAALVSPGFAIAATIAAIGGLVTALAGLLIPIVRDLVARRDADERIAMAAEKAAMATQRADLSDAAYKVLQGAITINQDAIRANQTWIRNLSERFPDLAEVSDTHMNNAYPPGSPADRTLVGINPKPVNEV